MARGIAGITGTGGEVRVGGRVAATLGPWTATCEAGDRWQVRADLAAVNPLWMAGQSACELRLAAGGHTWRWRDAGMSFEPTRAVFSMTGRYERVMRATGGQDGATGIRQAAAGAAGVVRG